MSPGDQTCASILVVGGFAALAGAAVMIGSVYEGRGTAAWIGAAVFVASSAGAAWCFWRLV